MTNDRNQWVDSEANMSSIQIQQYYDRSIVINEVELVHISMIVISNHPIILIFLIAIVNLITLMI